MQFKNHLLALTEQKFKDLEFNPVFAISTMLDLRFKKLHFQSALAASSAITKINTLIRNDEEALNLELRQYINLPVISRYENSLKHWEIVKSAYPSLCKLAMKYLSVVATSVPSERLFSRARTIKAENRSRLSGEHLNQ
ncbi:uncharacterized protein LOC143305601 [Osmia lignaria lignaria]|uniref:uncharacterized protein LOC143305601 n=1 Tax=Osmia lignaria lignaria TaxID=1437193 RepID=UPI00402B4731